MSDVVIHKQIMSNCCIIQCVSFFCSLSRIFFKMSNTLPLQLAAPLSAQFINMSQLDELVAVKAEYARLYTAAVQKYKQRKDAALPVGEALQELLAQVLQASRGITAALPASTTSASSSLDLDQPPLCHCLNLRLLQGSIISH